MTTPVLLDCDTGIDDAFALAYLSCRADAQLVGIVSTAGNVGADAVHRNNLALSELLGLRAPVAQGSRAPLAQPLMTAADTHGPTGLGHASAPAADRTTDPRSGAQLWVDAARTRPGELVGIVLGPHTNLALALEIEPALPRLLKRLHIMGGAINHRGNTGPTSEWNIAVDPEAAQRVLAAFSAAPQRPVMGTLEATETLRFEQAELERVRQLAEHSGHAVAAVLADGLRWYFEFHEADGLGWMAHVHDPIVAIHSLTGQFASTYPLAVDVELEGALTRGQTVGDVLGRWGRPPNVEVLTAVQPHALLEHLLGTLETAWT